MKTAIIKFIRNIEIVNSIIGLLGIAAILMGVAYLQLFYTETTCVSCGLQRSALFGAGLSLLMNLRYGNKVVHWACAILASCAGIAVSIHQILAHIDSTRGYGVVMHGLHIYTWAFICFAVIIVVSGLMLVVYPEESRS